MTNPEKIERIKAAIALLEECGVEAWHFASLRMHLLDLEGVETIRNAARGAG